MSVYVADVLVERGDKYGNFIHVAEVSQHLKAVIKAHLRERGKTLASDQYESLDMICNKIARIVNGDPDYADSWFDIAGYALLIADRLEGVKR